MHYASPWETLKEALCGVEPSKGWGILRKRAQILATESVLALSQPKFNSDCFN